VAHFGPIRLRLKNFKMSLSNFSRTRGSCLYALIDPAEPTQYRYIGKAKNPTKRFTRHIHEATTSSKNFHRVNWLRKVILEGRLPEMKVLAIFEDHEIAHMERRAIAAYRKAGHDLTNGTLGGDGCDPPTSETRARMSAAKKAAFARPDVKKRYSAALKAAHARPDVRAKLSAAKARPDVKERHSAAVKAAMARSDVKEMHSAAMKSAYANPDVRAKLSAALKVAHARPEVKERHRAAVKAAMARPDVKERHRAALKAALARPEVQIARLTRQLERLSCRVA